MSHTPTTPTGAPPTFDPRTAAILDRLQGHIPLVPRPFAAVASDLALTEDEVFRCIREQRARGVTRQISAIFDTRMLGYQSSLVAACYPEGALDTAAAVINRHPGVSHNYRRDHEFNLWYTIAVPPGRSLEADVDALHRASGALSSRLLPTLRTYKIGVRFRLGNAPGSADDSAGGRGHRIRSDAPAPLDDAAIRAVRALQLDLAAVERPFDEPAARHGFACAEELLRAGEALRANGALRRLSAVLYHREAGYAANGMVVWRATPQQCDAAGPVMASNAAVSHCYQRPAYPDWPYTLFTMIHGKTRDEVEAVTRELQEATRLSDYRIVYSTHEYKKVRVRYFDERLDAWDPGSASPSTPHPAGDT
jgi:DNA-binding Lrp family transcriptional regulator